MKLTLHSTTNALIKQPLLAPIPVSDIAVLKIEGKSFPYLVYGNSDDVKLGSMGIGSWLSAYTRCNRNCRYYQCKSTIYWY